MSERLTKQQQWMLAFLDYRGSASPKSPEIKRRVGMLRRMEERGLVHFSMVGRWFITGAGRLAIRSLSGDSCDLPTPQQGSPRHG